ncbi:MAG: UvrD-helicase domain-containing protein [Bacteroidales bacterium]|jgi:DNA helicase-2/ATP-dependent DNA helicase PcrA|nr:UvrD-helicase domain-containing protein [Bacteroidales bacterium]
MFELSDAKKELLKSDGNLLVLGGPGSGKTTIALLKAKHEISNNVLLSGQRILFLSFARVTVSRVEEKLVGLGFSKEIKRKIEINTYHGFTWNILKSHGYLLCDFRQIKLLPPPEAAAKLAEIDSSQRHSEQQRLFYEEGYLHFDLFAELCSNLLNQSDPLCKIICDRYPIIIFDEFQDTNLSEWELVKNLGRYSRIIALADAEQRIYDFRGADPKRIDEYMSHFKPTFFDFETENNRSNGTDITSFGNDLLKGGNASNEYNDVKCIAYPFSNPPHIKLKTEVLAARSRLNKDVVDWSLAILVPSNKLMLQVSDVLSRKQNFAGGQILPPIVHDVAIDQAALSLAAVFIAGLMEQGEPDLEIMDRLISHLNDYVRGRGNGKISKKDIGISRSLEQFIQTRASKTNKPMLLECRQLAIACSELQLCGDPIEDWINMRSIISICKSDTLNQIFKDAMFIKLLHRGSILQSGLAELWREQSNYKGAVNLVRNALLQEHFSMTAKVPKGILLMTIHKAKGKEFDEVIIYEDIYNGRFLHNSEDSNEVRKAKLLLRVAVTRAIKRATILTPSKEKCPLLF